MNGVVFNIQHFSLHDGPGIRTTVFLKGCPMRCAWCHNPEGLKHGPELRFYESRCVTCGLCFAVCPVSAHQMKDGRHWIDRNACTMCGACIRICPSSALEQNGLIMSPEEVLQNIVADKVLYMASGGGMTISGGEPLAQAGFAEKLLRLCRDEGISTAVESSLYGDSSSLERLIPYTDIWMADVKSLNSETHRNYTSRDNRVILNNLRMLAQKAERVIVRVPLIPGVNSSEVSAIKDFAAGLGITEIEVLDYHRIGEPKYKEVGLVERTFASDNTQADAEA